MSKIFEALGINGVSLLIYLGLFVVLAAVIIPVAVRPIKKIMAARRAQLDSVFEENKKLNSESLELKHDYEEKLHEAKREVARVSEETTRKAEKKGEQIIADAKREAVNIIKGAKAESDAERIRLTTEYKNNITELSVDIAASILEREVNKEDTKKIVDEALKKWAD